MKHRIQSRRHSFDSECGRRRVISCRRRDPQVDGVVKVRRADNARARACPSARCLVANLVRIDG